MSILVGRQAPDFSTTAILANGEIDNDFSLSKNIQNKYALLFFYPLDFTFVCPSELIALNHRMEAFEARGIEVMSVSIDSHFSHSAWRNTPINQGGIGPVHYTMIADLNHQICQAYGVEHPVASVAFRAAFIIDKKGMVRAQLVNDLPLGRNVDELLRLFDALDHHEQHGEVCPAGWIPGKAGMQATADGVAAYLSQHSEAL